MKPQTLTLQILALLLNPAMALNPSCAPGGNFDLSGFTLQLPTGQPKHPDSIPASQLTGCNGYQDYKTFFTESKDGALVMKVCGSANSCGCVTTANSLHCRTELRENQNWSPHASRNRLSATLSVPQPDDSQYGTVVGQIHIDEDISVRPVGELYYNRQGQLWMGIERTRDGGDPQYTQVGQVDVGNTFSYSLRYENGQLAVQINGGQVQNLPQYELDNPDSYFKVGNYNQGDAASDVHFLAIGIEH